MGDEHLASPFRSKNWSKLRESMVPPVISPSQKHVQLWVSCLLLTGHPLCSPYVTCPVLKTLSQALLQEHFEKLFYAIC